MLNVNLTRVAYKRIKHPYHSELDGVSQVYASKPTKFYILARERSSSLVWFYDNLIFKLLSMSLHIFLLKVIYALSKWKIYERCAQFNTFQTKQRTCYQARFLKTYFADIWSSTLQLRHNIIVRIPWNMCTDILGKSNITRSCDVVWVLQRAMGKWYKWV